jgi:hypothetical protein
MTDTGTTKKAPPLDEKLKQGIRNLKRSGGMSREEFIVRGERDVRKMMSGYVMTPEQEDDVWRQILEVFDES